MNPLSNPDPWNLVAADYDELILPLFEHFAADAIARLELGAAPARVLDVACGPGTASALLARAGHEVDAVDFSKQMIDRLRGKLAPGGPLAGQRIRPQLMDGQSLDFPDAQFAGALSLFGLMFFPDRARGFKELFRVLRPGGRACVSSWLPLAEVASMKWAFGALSAIMPPPEPGAPPRQPALEDPLAFAAELEAAGFRRVSVSKVSRPMPVTSIEEFWAGMVRSSAPIALFRRGMDEARWQELNQRAIEHLHATAPDDLAELTMDAWLGTGVRPG